MLRPQDAIPCTIGSGQNVVITNTTHPYGYNIGDIHLDLTPENFKQNRNQFNIYLSNHLKLSPTQIEHLNDLINSQLILDKQLEYSLKQIQTTIDRNPKNITIHKIQNYVTKLEDIIKTSKQQNMKSNEDNCFESDQEELKEEEADICVDPQSEVTLQCYEMFDQLVHKEFDSMVEETHQKPERKTTKRIKSNE